MKHRHSPTGIAVHAYPSLDVMAAMSICRNLQDQPIEAHAVVGAHGALELFAQDVVQTAANPKYKADLWEANS